MRRLFTASILAAVAVALLMYLIPYGNIQNKAFEQGDRIYLNGTEYSLCGYERGYAVSDKMICKTDSGKKIYQIEEYPNLEFIAVYSLWDGTIYCKTEDRDNKAISPLYQ